jgi:hypothetical protein
MKDQNNCGSCSSTVVAATGGCQMQPADMGKLGIDGCGLLAKILAYRCGIHLHKALCLQIEAFQLFAF